MGVVILQNFSGLFSLQTTKKTLQILLTRFFFTKNPYVLKIKTLALLQNFLFYFLLDILYIEEHSIM